MKFLHIHEKLMKSLPSDSEWSIFKEAWTFKKKNEHVKNKNRPDESEGTLNLCKQDTQGAHEHRCLNKFLVFHPDQNLFL